MIRGSTKIFLETLAAVAAVAMVLAGVAVWRFSAGPLSIASVTPYIEAALSDPANGRRVSIGASSLVWDPGEHAVEVRADRVAVFDAENRAVMVVPEMMFRFRLAALLRGIVAPRAITLVRPAVTVIRDADRAWQFSAVPESDQEPAAAQSGDTGAIVSLVERSLAQLDRFRLIDARLVVDDRHAGALWVLPRVSAALQRVRDGFDAQASLELELDGGPVALRAAGRLDTGYDLIDADITVGALPIATIAARIEELSRLTPLDLPVGGTLHVARRASGAAPDVAFDLVGGPGQIVRPELPGGQLAVNGVSLRGRYTAAGERLALDELVLELPTTAITVSASAYDLSGAAAVAGSVAVASLPLDDLRKYWPTDMGDSARRWILANMSQGAIHDVSARFTGQRVDDGFELATIDGQLSVEGARVRYMRQQPAVDQVSGLVRFDNRHFDIAVRAGRLRGLKIDNAQLTISGLEDPDQQMAMQVDVSGPVSDALALLDQPPFGYVRRFGVAWQSIGGDMATRLSLRFPLIDRLALDDVGLGVTASLRGLRVPKLVRDYDLTDGRFDLNLDKAGMGLMGEARIGGVLASASWDERFDRVAPFRRRYDLSATLSDADRRALGIGLADQVAGPVGLTATYTEQVDRRSRLVGALDFGAAALAIDELGWRKAVAQPATGRFEATLADGRLTTLERAELTGGGLSLRASGAFGAESRLAKLDIQELKAGATDIAARVAWPPAAVGGAEDKLRERMELSVTGASLDASALFGGDGIGSKPPRAMVVSAKLERVLVGPGRQLAKVQLQGDSDGTRWRRASIAGTVGTGGMTLSLTPDTDGRVLTVVADDAGAVLQTFGLSDAVQGGRLRVDGRYRDHAAADPPDAPPDTLNARVAIDSYRVVHAPLLAKLLAVTSITGIPDLMANEGIGFQELSLQLVKAPNRLQIIDGRASGTALGLTVQGTIQGPDDVADLTGTIVPVYSVNRLFEAIPVIGDIVTGGGGGLFAFTYSVRGPLDHPSITVNPLSVLAPGFLRNLFHWLPALSSTPSGAPPPSVSGQ